MPDKSLAEFADKLTEIMPVLMKASLKGIPQGFYKTKITMPQFIVLDMLNRSGEMKMTDLAHLLNVTTAAVTGLVDRLTRDGFVARQHNAEDRRIVKVKMTAKGAGVVGTMIEKRKKATMEIFGMISQEERDEYLRILMHIRDHLVEQNKAEAK